MSSLLSTKYVIVIEKDGDRLELPGTLPTLTALIQDLERSDFFLEPNNRVVLRAARGPMPVVINAEYDLIDERIEPMEILDEE